MPTYPGGFSAGDTLGAADMNALPGGQRGFASVTANQTGITTVTDLTSLTVTWTAVSSRRYPTSFCVGVYSSTASDYIEVVITDSTPTTKHQTGVIAETINSGTGERTTLSGSVCETGLSGSTTRKLRMFINGAGTGQMIASSTAPAYILVEDIGPA